MQIQVINSCSKYTLQFNVSAGKSHPQLNLASKNNWNIWLKASIQLRSKQVWEVLYPSCKYDGFEGSLMQFNFPHVKDCPTI